MKRYLTQKDRATILKELTKEQKKTLFTVVGKRHRFYFADVLAKYKGTRDWGFYFYIDHGRVRKDITCECGRPLRHQYILVNKRTKEKRTIGSTHLIEGLRIPQDIAKEVLQGIHNINYDLDELLQKYNNGWELPPYVKKNIGRVNVPKDIKKLLVVDLPLLHRHLDLLFDKISKCNSKRRKTKHVFKTDNGFEYEIENNDIYKVLIGEIEPFSYINTFRQEIYRFLKKKVTYVPIYDVINYLVDVGLPNDLMYGQHALTNYLRRYLEVRTDIATEMDLAGYPYYRLQQTK
jgi:hypothetical protein